MIPPLVPTPATRTLPVELLPLLLSYCSPSTLAAFCSVSFEVLKLAGPTLYSTLVIREPEDYLYLFRKSDVAFTSLRIAPFLAIQQVKHLVLAAGLRQVLSSTLCFDRIGSRSPPANSNRYDRNELKMEGQLKVHSLTLTNPDTSDFSGLFNHLSPTHLVLCRPQGERSIFDHAIDVRAEDTILSRWKSLKSVTLRGANFLSLRPTRSGAFFNNSEFFLVPASAQGGGPGGGGFGGHQGANGNQVVHAGFHHHQTLAQHHSAGPHTSLSAALTAILAGPSQPSTRNRTPISPLNIVFDLRPAFLPPHLVIPSPLTTSWFMRFLRAREMDGIFNVPGLKGGRGPGGEPVGGGRMIVRVADEQTKDWVERGRIHLRGEFDDLIEVVVGDESKGSVDGWPLV